MREDPADQFLSEDGLGFEVTVLTSPFKFLRRI